MFRQEIIGEKFTIAFGVDHVTGAFMQLWANPAAEQDGALIRIDGNMVDTDYEAEFEFEPRLKRFLDEMVKRQGDFKKIKPGESANIGEQDVIELARAAGGFPDIAMDVYRVFGDDI